MPGKTYRPLKISAISATNLKDVNNFTKMSVYAEVSINGKPETKTPVAKKCGSNPEWDCTVQLLLAEDAIRQDRVNLQFLLRSERTKGDTDIGTVTVSIKDLLDRYRQQTVSSGVKLMDETQKGTLRFRYLFEDCFTELVSGGAEDIICLRASANGGPSTSSGKASFKGKEVLSRLAAFAICSTAKDEIENINENQMADE